MQNSRGDDVHCRRLRQRRLLRGNRRQTDPLRASGDTCWSFYGQVLGLYVFALPVTFSARLPFRSRPRGVTPLGIGVLYAALILETLVPTIVTYYWFENGAWKAISRSYRPTLP